MFQLLLRARTQGFWRDRLGGQEFRSRSPSRDAETDRARVEAIVDALESALEAAQNEQSGLSRRVEDVLARAAVTFGNGNDEYLERETLDSHHHDLFDQEIQNGQRRISQLSTSIAHFKFLKAALLSRFPEYRPADKRDIEQVALDN